MDQLFHFTIDGLTGFSYILSRTSLRPREVLQFIGHAHRLACEQRQTGFTVEVLKKAEEDYSTWKLEHVASEYAHIYPRLSDLLWAFRGLGPALSEADMLAVVENHKAEMRDDERSEWLNSDGADVTQVLYRVEFLGVARPVPSAQLAGLLGRYEYAYERRAASVRLRDSFCIHPAFWSVLEVPYKQV